MINIPIYHYDAFTNIPNKGNPAGVVLNADCLNDAQMQDIARNIGFNETAFVIKSNNETLRIRYFTPGHEINLCGHATIASLYCMKSRGLLNEIEALTIETNAGILPVRFFEKDKNIIVSMKQAPPQFKEFIGSIVVKSCIIWKYRNMDFISTYKKTGNFFTYAAQ